MTKPGIRAFVSGRVQGVFYRASLARKAKQLGLTGFVRNLADGRVEYLAIGGPAAVDALKSWSYVGPSAAHVKNVELVEYDGGEVYSDFAIRY